MLQKSYYKKSHIYTSISRLIAILLTVSIFVLTDFVIPVKADDDAEVFYIPFDRASAWHYWLNHITDNDQRITLNASSGTESDHLRTTVTYSTTGMNAADINQLIATLSAGGCTYDASTSGKIVGTCPAVASAGVNVYNHWTEHNEVTLLHELPLIKGTITQTGSYSGSDCVYLNTNKPFVMAFYIQGYIPINEQKMNVYYSDGSTDIIQGYFTSFMDDSVILGFTVTNTGTPRWATLSIPYINGKSYPLQPIYLGELESASNETLSILRYESKEVSAIKLQTQNINSYITGQTNSLVAAIESQTSSINSNIDNTNSQLATSNNLLQSIKTYLENGKPDTSNKISNNSTSNNNFNNSSNELVSIEDSAIDDLDDTFADINTDSNLLRSSQFITTANWVTQQFNRIVINKPFELVISFSMILGLALVFIGKVK